jgi:hypothetical protein
MAVGGVADVRRLALNEPVMKVAATNGYKKATPTFGPTPVGAAEGCDLLIWLLLLKSQNQKIAAFGSSYKSGSKARRTRKKNAPNQSGRFHEDAASVLQRFSEHHPDAMRPG